MSGDMLTNPARPDEQKHREWLAATLSLRRWQKRAPIPLLLVVAVLAWSGYALGQAVAPQIGRAQAARVDRTAPRVSTPPVPAAPHYPLTTPLPLAPATGPDTGTGARFGADEATAISQPGLPITFRLPEHYPWYCVVLSVPDGSARPTAEWECTADYPNALDLHVLLAPCASPCDSAARERLRPPFAFGPGRAVDPVTWLAERTTKRGTSQRSYFHLVLEHVWQAPTGAFGPGSASQTLYVVALVATSGDRILAEKVVNDLRTRM
ncbi:hypothetical protein [Plantactinospora soyae]|uniref:Uncharacterized protein n=1 Tax=Plantactinospora soyae TaxID=1544732 RepID=A0A927M6S4_9ACTN|nr:hypothetical protein [Plantactinospora soyae]MBE1487656.1 hypothetical protein [Plantactinospora soyae]